MGELGTPGLRLKKKYGERRTWILLKNKQTTTTTTTKNVIGRRVMVGERKRVLCADLYSYSSL